MPIARAESGWEHPQHPTRDKAPKCLENIRKRVQVIPSGSSAACAASASSAKTRGTASSERWVRHTEDNVASSGYKPKIAKMLRHTNLAHSSRDRSNHPEPALEIS